MFFIENLDKDSKDALSNLASISNRKIQIYDSKIPIVFFSDFRYSTIYNKLNADSSFTCAGFSLGGYIVKFSGRFTSGKVIESGWSR